MKNLKIATWNVNSIKVRIEQVKNYLITNDIDILLLQELKVRSESFPFSDFTEIGYNCKIVSQPTYNGVAILSKAEIQLINNSLYPELAEEQARWLHCKISSFDIINCYFPNGNPIDSDKFAYKIEFMTKVQEYLKRLLKVSDFVVLGGDYNVALNDYDVYEPQAFKNDAIFQDESRLKMQGLLNLGLYDSFRSRHADAQNNYSWWSYRGGGYERGKGALIDNILCSGAMIDKLEACYLDEKIRGNERPSDHCPVVSIFKDL